MVATTAVVEIICNIITGVLRVAHSFFVFNGSSLKPLKVNS